MQVAGHDGDQKVQAMEAYPIFQETEAFVQGIIYGNAVVCADEDNTSSTRGRQMCQ